MMFKGQLLNRRRDDESRAGNKLIGMPIAFKVGDDKKRPEFVLPDFKFGLRYCEFDGASQCHSVLLSD